MVSNNNFLLGEIPKYHAILQRFERQAFWKEQKKRCIEGYWSSGKWMPGTLYYYVNFHHISIEDDVALSRVIGLPFLRDIEWEKAYIYEEASGFSGFTLDDTYTCHEGALDILKAGVSEEDIKTEYCINKKTGEIIENRYKNLFNSQGRLKKYINAREYLRKEFSQDLGKPLYYNEAKNVLDLEARGGGKDLEASTLIYYEDGVKPISQVSVGDRIFGADGELTTVVDRKDFSDQVQYKVTFSDGRSILCGGGHLWTVYRKQRNCGYKKVTLELKSILSDYKIGKREDSRYYVDINKPINYSEKKLPIDPYYLGLWLGDGNSHNTGITTADNEIVEYLNEFVKHWDIDVIKRSKYHYALNKKGNYKGGNKLLTALQKLNVINNKHIPDIYLKGSVDQRLSLLQGLMDSDGYADNRHIELTTSYDGLKNTIPELIKSLGIRCKTRIKKTSGKDALRISLLTELPVFRLPRKLQFVGKNQSKYAITNRTKSAIINIEEVGIMPSVCIAVDNNDKLFIAGDYIVTHNSFWSSALIAHNFIFDGATDYEVYLERKRIKEPLKSDTVVGAIDSKFSSDLLGKVTTAFDNFKDKQVIDEVTYNCPLFPNWTGSLYSGRKTITSSTGSVLNHRTFSDDPLAANGTRPNRAFLEEVGFMNNLTETWGAIEATQASSQFKNLVIYGLGTGGLTKSGTAMYAKDVFYNPEDYNCLVFEDIWENRGKIGFFLPATHTLNKYKEGENLITNEEKALTELSERREKAKQSNSKKRYMTEVINAPLTHSEIFLTEEGNFFPTQDLKDILGNLLANQQLLDASWKVEMTDPMGLNYQREKWKFSDKKTLKDFPHRRDSNLDCPVEIFIHPQENFEGDIPYGRYIAGCDPVDNDGGDDTVHSLQSTWILDTFTDQIVAEYTARTKLVDDYFEQQRRLLIYYNAQMNYESNKKGLYAYYKRKQSLYLLAETPEILRDQNMVKTEKVGNLKYGVNANNRINNWALELILAWLEKNYHFSDEESPSLNMHHIRSIGLLMELIAYSKEINTDRISALGMAMILREDKQLRISNNVNKPTKTAADDDFWFKARKSNNIRKRR